MQMAPLTLGCGFSYSAMGSKEDSPVGQRKEMYFRNRVETSGLYSSTHTHTHTPILSSVGSIHYSHFELVLGSGKDTIAGGVLSPRPYHTTSWHLSFSLHSLTFGYFSFLSVFSFFLLSSLFVSSTDFIAPSAYLGLSSFLHSLCFFPVSCLPSLRLDSVALISEVATCHLHCKLLRFLRGQNSYRAQLQTNGRPPITHISKLLVAILQYVGCDAAKSNLIS